MATSYTPVAQELTSVTGVRVSSANAFYVGPNGTTNPTFVVVTNVASAATGLSVTGNAAGSGVTLTALSSGSNEGITLTTKGTGIVNVNFGGDGVDIANLITLNRRGDGSGVENVALAFNASTVAEAASAKAGIALVRNASFGRGDIVFYNDATADTSVFTTADEVMRLESSFGRLLLGTATPPAGTGERLTIYSSATEIGMQITSGSGGGLTINGNQGGGGKLYTHTGVMGSESYTNVMTFLIGSVTVNSGTLDIDFKVGSDANANALWSDAGAFAGVGALGFGAVVSTAAHIIADHPALTATSNSEYHRMHIANSAAITITGATTSAVVSTLKLSEPNITATGTVTIGATLYIVGEPTEGGTNYAEYIAAGDVRWAAYGAGAATFDANGIITSVSDERLKDVQGPFLAGLAELRNVNPIMYNWKEGGKFATEHTYAGFGANNVHAAIPLATGMSKDGYRSLQDRALLAALVNAVKELDSKVNGVTNG